ncbi:MAG: 16S rRNA (guanine(527)-N(7))-methyltransferase RsmG [Pikeienuella sp.]
MTPEAFAAEYGVSRETLARLTRYAALLEQWGRAINLVSRATLPDLWQRHIADSAQLMALAPACARSWLDLGAGAGLPGLVIAALAAERGSPAVTLVEADTRKAAFLVTAAREMELSVEVVPRRIEALSLPEPPDILSARALAPLSDLCAMAERLAGPDTVCLFPKGVRADFELTEAGRHWHYHVTKIASRTDGKATILRLTQIRNRAGP